MCAKIIDTPLILMIIIDICSVGLALHFMMVND